MCFSPPPLPQRYFKKENIDSGGVQRFRAVGEPTFPLMPELGGRPCPVPSVAANDQPPVPSLASLRAR